MFTATNKEKELKLKPKTSTQYINIWMYVTRWRWTRHYPWRGSIRMLISLLCIFSFSKVLQIFLYSSFFQKFWQNFLHSLASLVHRVSPPITIECFSYILGHLGVACFCFHKALAQYSFECVLMRTLTCYFPYFLSVTTQRE